MAFLGGFFICLLRWGVREVWVFWEVVESRYLDGSFD